MNAVGLFNTAIFVTFTTGAVITLFVVNILQGVLLLWCFVFSYRGSVQVIRSFTSKACRGDWGTRSIKVSRAAFTQGGGGVDYHSRRRRIPRSVLQDTTAGAERGVSV